MTKRMIAIGCGAAMLCSAMAVATPAQAEVCADRTARQTLEMRVLQSELMVAALTCGQRQSYNDFVVTFKPFLKSQGAQLRTFFVEQFGPSQGPDRLNRMVTRLANAASQRSLSQSTDAFCAQTKKRFDQVLSANAQNLVQLARTSPSASDHGFRTCVEVAGAKSQDAIDQN